MQCWDHHWTLILGPEGLSPQMLLELRKWAWLRGGHSYSKFLLIRASSCIINHSPLCRSTKSIRLFVIFLILHVSPESILWDLSKSYIIRDTYCSRDEGKTPPLSVQFFHSRDLWSLGCPGGCLGASADICSSRDPFSPTLAIPMRSPRARVFPAQGEFPVKPK